MIDRLGRIDCLHRLRCIQAFAQNIRTTKFPAMPSAVEEEGDRSAAEATSAANPCDAAELAPALPVALR